MTRTGQASDIKDYGKYEKELKNIETETMNNKEATICCPECGSMLKQDVESGMFIHIKRPDNCLWLAFHPNQIEYLKLLNEKVKR